MGVFEATKMMGFRADAIMEEILTLENQLNTCTRHQVRHIYAKIAKLQAEYDRLTASPFEMLKKQQEMN